MKNMYSFFDRATKKMNQEPVYGLGFLSFAYTHPFGKVLLEYLFSRKPLNQLYGIYKRSRFSQAKIEKDIEEYGIDLNEFREQKYRNYSDFFLRKFKDGRRAFSSDLNELGAFAEGKYLAFASIDEGTRFPVKGQVLNLERLFGDQTQWSERFRGGSAWICRLCPIDYHWFHFPCSGKIIDQYAISGRYHSVSMYALSHRSETLFTNERQINILDTGANGLIALIEVGALCVGKIKSVHERNRPFAKGEIKGYFDFGASTVIVLTEKGKWQPDPDLIAQTVRQVETQVRLGDSIGRVHSL